MSSVITHEIRSDIDSLRRVWALAGPLRTKVALGILFRFLQSICLGCAFGCVIWVVTELSSGRPVERIWVWQVTSLMVLSLAGQIMFGFLSVTNSWLSSYALAGNLRLGILDLLSRLPMGFHLSRHRGDTVTVLTADMQMLESFMSDALPRIAQAFGLPLAVIAFLFWRDWQVALAGLVAIALALPIFFWSSRRLAMLGIRRQDMQARAGARMIEYAQGIAVIRAFNRVAKGEESFRDALTEFRDLSIRMVVELCAPMVSFSGVLMLGVPLVITVASARFTGGATDMGTFIAAMVLVFSIYSPLTGLAEVMELSRAADASLTRIDRIVTTEPLPETSAPREPDGFSITFDNVDFSYENGTQVLSDLSFSVPERTMTAIVGPSGAGKSTILNLLPRFWDVTAGSVSIGGTDIRDISSERLNQLITVVFQDVYLFAGTIYDNIALGRPDASLSDIEAAARAAQAHEFISALPEGYQTRIGEGGATLSGGERQRVSIARAILKNAPIVLLDEATAAIDPTNERALQIALASLVRNKTLIVVAHKLTTIRAADQILVLDKGYITEHGSHDELINHNGAYAQLWSGWVRASEWRLGKE